MSNRWRAPVVVVGVLSLGISPAFGQTKPESRTPKADARKAWTPARTPWGDPDIAGLYTNKDEQGVPMERPAELAGRDQVTAGEFADRLARAARQLEVDNAEFDVETADTRNAGAVGSATSPPPHWLDRGKPSHRTSRIVDPADGRI